MRIALAVLMALHGIVHTAGFATSWNLAPAAGAPYRTTVLGGRVDLGKFWMRAFGVLWLAGALAFIAMAVGAAFETTWWRQGALVAATGSLLLSLLEMPQARPGVFINLFIIVVLLVA